MSLYRSLIKQAFVIAWEHKYLWFFGLFATLVASNLEIELVNRFANRGFTLYDWQRWADTGIFSSKTLSNLGQLAQSQTGSFISLLVIIAIFLALMAGLVWLSVVSQIALVSNSNKALGTGRRLTVAERRHDTSVGFKEGRKYFWRVLVLNIVVRFTIYILAAISIVPVMIWTAGQGPLFSLVYLVGFIVFLGIALSWSLISKYAIADIVIRQRPFGEAVRSSWKLFWNNWLVSLEMAFVLFALSLVASIVIILGVMVIAIPFGLLYVAAIFLGSYPIFVVVIILAVLASLGIIIIGGSILTVVQTTAWVGLFNQLMGKGAESKLERVFKE